MKTNNNTAIIAFAYLTMILIWSTTPLAIKWSSDGIDFITGLVLRMFIGTTVATILCIFLNEKLPINKKSLQVYFASSISIYGAMMLVYYGAQFTSSGLVSVIFGMTPIFTSLFASQLFSSEKMTMNKLLGSLIGVAGLTYIFSEQISMGTKGLEGVLTILLAVMMHSISAIWIKQIDIKLPALTVTTGGLVFSLPLFFLTFWFFSQPFPGEFASRTLLSIIYLGIMGSVVGFVSYYYVLANLSPSTVALATLITPISALLLGNTFNQESVTTHIWIGTGLILGGLITHQFNAMIAIELFKQKKL